MNRDELQSAYDEAGSTSELARRLGVTYRVARYRLEKQGVKTRKRAADSRQSHRTADEWRRLYDEAGSISALARQIGSTNTTVRYHLLRYGIPLRSSGYKSPKTVTYAGEAHPNWRGGTYRHSQGYIYEYAPDHPDAAKAKGYVLQHRLVMERHLGRPLRPDEIVHHRNEVKDDNRVENLEILSRTKHMRHHKAATARDDHGRFA